MSLYETDAVSLKGCVDGTVVRLRNGVVATITEDAMEGYWINFPGLPQRTWVLENGCYPFGFRSQFDVMEIVKLGDAPVIRQPSTKVIVLKAGSAAVFTSVEEAVRASDPGTEILEVEVKARHRVSVTKTAVPVK